MDQEIVAFAAARNKRLTAADTDLRPSIKSALTRESKTGWDDVVDKAGLLWEEMFSDSAPRGYKEAALAAFKGDLKELLAKTGKPSDPSNPTDGEIDRVTKWASTYTVNNATYQGAFASGQRKKQWITMHDAKVRHQHAVVNGQEVSIGGTFDVGGSKLHYPGEPIGDPSNWINCRCLIRGVGKGITMGAETTTFADDTAPIADDTAEPDDTADPTDGEALVDDPIVIPFHGVLCPTGVPSGDGRMFATGGASWRDLPLPMAYQTMTGEAGHVNSVTVGTIENITIDENGLLQYNGFFNSNPLVQTEIIPGLADGSIRGVSVDADMVTIDLEASTPMDDVDTFMANKQITVFDTMRVAGATIVAIPAFQEAYIALGECDCPPDDAELHDEKPAPADIAAGLENKFTDDDFEVVFEQDFLEFLKELSQVEVTAAGGVMEFAPGTHDGPGWITNPKATERIRRYWTHGEGAAKIKWGVPGDFNRCRKQLAKYVQNPEWLAGLCANMHKEAIGVWPGQEDGGKRKHELDGIVAAGGKMAPSVHFVKAKSTDVYPGEWFEDPQFDEITQLTITPEGRVFGHLAQWGVCHIGIDGFCSMPASSPTNYSLFHTGYVETDRGDLPVGHLLGGIGHAALGIGMARATQFYDRPDSIWADVAIGEDAFGIWYNGVLRASVTDQYRKELKATGAMSGDWRRTGFGQPLELVAAVSVGVPGYPVPNTQIAASFGYQDALVASGIVLKDAEHPTPLTLDVQLGIVRAAAEQAADLIQERSARSARLVAAREKAALSTRQARLDRAKGRS